MSDYKGLEGSPREKTKRQGASWKKLGSKFTDQFFSTTGGSLVRGLGGIQRRLARRTLAIIEQIVTNTSQPKTFVAWEAKNTGNREFT